MKIPFYERAKRTLVEVLDGGKSILRYRGSDKQFHYIASSESPNGMQGIPVIEVSGTTPSQELAPGVFYKFGSVDSLTLTLGTPVSGVLNMYTFAFTAGENFDPSTDLSLPEDVLFNGEISMETGDECEVSIRDNRATFTVWSVPAADPTDESIAGE